MADIAEPHPPKRPFVRVALEYVLACFLAFGAFMVLQYGMVRISNLILGEPASHHAEMLYLSIAAVSVAFADPVGVLQQREGWQGHAVRAGATLCVCFGIAFAYVAISGH
ncbi:MAG: hypothetical protein AAFP98_11990 [Pseudomonadota bacterium]